jgi:hypothetical protein
VDLKEGGEWARKLAAVAAGYQLKRYALNLDPVPRARF